MGVDHILCYFTQFNHAFMFTVYIVEPEGKGLQPCLQKGCCFKPFITKPSSLFFFYMLDIWI